MSCEDLWKKLKVQLGPMWSWWFWKIWLKCQIQNWMYFAYKSKSVSNSYIFMVHVTTFNFIYHRSKLWFEDVIATHWWILTVFINVKFLRWRKLVRFPLTQCYISPLENSDQISIELMLTLSILVWDINWLSIHLTTIKDAS